jgi:hypothetical protein
MNVGMIVVWSVPRTDRLGNGPFHKRGLSPFLEAAGEHGPEVIAQLEVFVDRGASKIVAVFGQILAELL